MVTKSLRNRQNDNFVTNHDHHLVTKSDRKPRNDNFVMNRDYDRSQFWRPTVILQFCILKFILSVFISYIKECESVIVTESPHEKSLDPRFMTKLYREKSHPSPLMTKL